MAEQPSAHTIPDDVKEYKQKPVQHSLPALTREICSYTFCKIICLVLAVTLTIVLLWDYHYFKTKYIFCQRESDACDAMHIDLLPTCPNATIYIDIGEDNFIIDALFGHNDYNYSNYPIKYHWSIITNDAKCGVIIQDTEQQQLAIHDFSNCDPFTLNATLDISIKEFEMIHPKQCNVSIFFFESPIFGIDFGTTYSSISFQRKYKNDNNQRSTLIVDDFSGKNNGNKLIRSAVYFHSDGQTTSVGQEAIDYLETDAENVIYDIKRMMGRNASQDYEEFEDFHNTHFFKINDDNDSIFIPNWNRSVTFEQTVAIIFGYLVESASDEWLKNKTYFDDKFNDFSKVVVSIPASFHTGQRNAIRNACILAGLTPLRLQSEPSLAAISFTHNISHDETTEHQLKSFLAFDFGGGTLDCAIIRCTRQVQCTVLSVYGDNHLGGIDFDDVIQHIIEEKLRDNDTPDYKIDELKFTIESMAEEIKIQLSKESKVLITINKEKIEITRDEFENHPETQKLINQMNDVVEEVIERTLKLQTKHSKVSIRAILLIGGTSKLPLVRASLSKYKFFYSQIDEQLMIADGAGVVSGALNYKDDILSAAIIDVAPLPYGFARCEATPTGLYPVNAEECNIMQKISHSGQFFGTKLSVAEICQVKAKSTSMKLDLFEGVNNSVIYNYFLGEIIIHDIEPRDPNKPCGNILLFGEIAKTGSLVFNILQNPIWDIINQKYEAEHGWNTEEIEKSNLYSLPQLYSKIAKYLRKQNRKKRWYGDEYTKQPYTFNLTIEEGMDKITKSINIVQEDIDAAPHNKYEYTMNAEEDLYETDSSFIDNMNDTKSLFDNNTFISVRYGIERAIRKEQQKQFNKQSKNQTKPTNIQIYMQELERLALKLERYDEISPEIATAALLSSLSYLAPYDKKRIISDIVYNNTLYVIFTGTQPNVHDMSFNVDIWKASKFGGRVHNGFHKRAVDYFGNSSFGHWFNSIFKNPNKKIFNNIQTHTEITQILFAGHSLGGAASEIVGAYFWEYCNRIKNTAESTFCSIPSQVITFGAPLAFQRGCNVHPNMTHIINDNDMIPRILRDFEFLYSGWFTIQMLWPHVPHVFAVTVFLSMLSIRYTRYHTVQTIFVCGIWVLIIYHWFSTETIRIDLVQYISPIFKRLGLQKVFCDQFHGYVTREIGYMWVIHLIMVFLLALKRWVAKSFDDDETSKLQKVYKFAKYLFQPILDFFPILLRISAMFVPLFVGICFIAPHYYATGNVIHIQTHHRHGVCNKMSAIDFYEKMRTGYQESFFFHDHSIVNYTEVLKSLIEGQIECGNKLPEASMGQEAEDVVSLLMVIVCVLFFWIYFLKVATKSANKTDTKDNKPPFNQFWGYGFLLILSVLSYWLGPMREYFISSEE